MSFLIGLSVVLGLFLVVQIIRVFELTSKIKEDDQSKVGMRENRRRALSWPLFVVGYFALFVWVVLRWGPHMLPESASLHGESIDFLFDLNWLIIIIAFVITHVVLGWFAAAYFERPGSKAQFITHNNKLEMVWTVVPAAVLAVIIIYGL
jgi:cytochrome c oxidase subunit 2